MLRSVCVFCGSKPGNSPRFAEVGRAMGQALARAGVRLVYGGGKIGLMGIVSRAVGDAGGEAYGVVPSFLVHEVDLDYGTMEIVSTINERMARFAELSDGYIVLPGAVGTYEELFRVVVDAALGVCVKPVVLLDAEGYWEPLLAVLDRAVADGFMGEDYRRLVRLAATPEEALRMLSERLADR